MRLRRARVLVVVSALFAGLLAVQPGNAGHNPGSEYFDLDKLPPVTITGKQMVDGLDKFVNDFPYRLTGGPTERLAAQALADEMAGIGYTSAVEELPVNQSGNSINAPLLKVVTATKKGTSRPDEWILFVGHYDTIASTIWGAYDNGAGTSLIRYMAHQLKDVPTNRSLMFAWYNGEEEGLLASKSHAAKVKAEGMDIKAVLGFDMPGIAWPLGPDAAANNPCLCMWHSPAHRNQMRPLLEYVNYDFLGFEKARSKVSVEGNTIRNSDEKSFENQGYPVLRWAGMRTAGSYPAYHLPHDTMDTIYAQAGGREWFEKGSLNTLTTAYYTALALDNHLPAPAAEASVDGLTAAFDASGSSDEDGAPSEFTWDFGDGTTGTGVDATHTYAAPGEYAVTLTVADNLWSEVTRSTTFSVTVG